MSCSVLDSGQPGEGEGVAGSLVHGPSCRGFSVVCIDEPDKILFAEIFYIKTRFKVIEMFNNIKSYALFSNNYILYRF